MNEKVIVYIKNLGADKGISVDPDTDLFAAGVLDSLEIISFLTYLQEELHISFTPDDLNYENYQTIRSILDWVSRQVS